MRGNGKVFISHTHVDNERCEPLLMALDAWGVDYWFDRDQLGPGQHLTERIQTAIAGRSIMLRICTGTTIQSFWMAQEMSAFRGMQIEEQRQRRSERLSINLILEPSYKAGAPYATTPSERADVTIDATDKPRTIWMRELRSALGLPTATSTSSAPRMSRRAALGLGAAGVVTVAAAGAAGVLLTKRGSTPYIPVPKPKVIPFDTPTPLDPRVQWYFKVHGSASIAQANDTLFVAADDGLYALNKTDSAIRWENPHLFGNSHTSMTVAGPALYTGGGLGTIYALNAADGSEIWHTSEGSLFSDSSFTYASGVLYTYPSDGYINAINATNGKQIWRGANVGKPDFSHPVPAVDTTAGQIFVGSTDGNLYALKASDGSIAWQHLTGGQIVGKPTVANGLVYFGSKDKSVYALHTADGSVAWTFKTDYELDYAPAVANGIAYIPTKYSIAALDATSGKVLWQAPAGDSVDAEGYVPQGELASSAAIVAGNHVYANFGGYLYCFSAGATKKPYLWRFLTTKYGNNQTLPIVDSGVVYWAGDNHTVYALSDQ